MTLGGNMVTKLVRHFDIDGNELEPTHIPISDEELYQEQLTQEFNDIHEKAILALNNWGSLTLAQKDAILKNLLRYALWKEGWLKLGVLQ